MDSLAQSLTVMCVSFLVVLSLKAAPHPTGTLLLVGAVVAGIGWREENKEVGLVGVLVTSVFWFIVLPVLLTEEKIK